jgi:cyclopropane fatty-acyl-phospholipid synthase-like methyltransferase
MPDDAKKLVQAGYDAVASQYAGWAARISNPAREMWTAFLLETVPAGAALLDLGCGNGLPSTRDLAGRFDVTGVDISIRQIEAARQHVAGATFIHADLMDLEFGSESFAAVTAFYSLIHLPREEQPLLLSRVASWLLPGGYLVAVFGVTDSAGDVEPDWLGAAMFWSSYPPAVNEQMAGDAGLEIVSSTEETILEDGQPVCFHWLVARRPAGGSD